MQTAQVIPFSFEANQVRTAIVEGEPWFAVKDIIRALDYSVDINMSFNSMVWFMVKWAIAAIPALIILFFIALAVMVMFGVSLR